MRNLGDTVAAAGNFLDWFNLVAALDDVDKVASSGEDSDGVSELWGHLEAMRGVVDTPNRAIERAASGWVPPEMSWEVFKDPGRRELPPH